MSSSSATACQVVYQDNWLLVVDKTEGLLSHPNRSLGEGRQGPACAFEGNYDFEDRRFDAPQGSVWLIHRLDQDTSGLLLASFDKETARRMRELMDQDKVEKKYLALVAGQPPTKGRWSDHLEKKRENSRVRSFVVRRSRPNAHLQYSVKRAYRRLDLSLIEVSLMTGKTHQIRVQCAHRGYPVAGDRVYGDFTFNKELKKKTGLNRLFLHAASVSFQHPRTGQLLKLHSYLPKELEEPLSRLK